MHENRNHFHHAVYSLLLIQFRRVRVVRKRFVKMSRIVKMTDIFDVEIFLDAQYHVRT